MIACIAIWFVEASICLFGTVVSGRRFEEILPVGMIGLVLWAYVWGLLGALYAGVMTALILGVLLGVTAVILVLSRRRAFAPKRFFTPAFFAYLALVGVAVYISLGRAVVNWDECSHWATVAKAMSYERAFSTNPDCHILFRSYPPGVSIYQYFYQAVQTLFTGEPFSEWLLYAAYDAFCFALIMPVLRFIKRKPWLCTPPACVLLAALPLCWFDTIYASLYVDGLLAMLAAYALMQFRFSERGGLFDTLACCTALFMLVLVKDAGLFFAVMIPLCAFIADWIHRGRGAWRVGSLWPYVACALSVALAKLSWSREVAQSGVRVAFNESVDLGQLLRILSGAEQGYQRTILHNFVKKFFSPALSVWKLDISFCAIFLALAALTALLYLLIVKRGGEMKRASAAVWSPLWIALIYILGLGVLYLFKFGEYEGVNLASYARYVKIGFLFWSLALAGEWIYFLSGHVKRPLLPLLLSGCLVLAGALAVGGLMGMLTRRSVRASVAEQAPFREAAALVAEHAEPGARVYVLTQALDGYEYYLLRFLMYPRRINEGGFSVGEPFYEGDIWTRSMTAEAWRDALAAEYGYVLVYQGNDWLNEECGALFPAGAQDSALYRFDAEAGALYPIFATASADAAAGKSSHTGHGRMKE